MIPSFPSPLFSLILCQMGLSAPTVPTVQKAQFSGFNGLIELCLGVMFSKLEDCCWQRLYVTYTDITEGIYT